LRIPLAFASVTVVVAVFLSAECKEYWQFLLCQGFLLGVCSLCQQPASVVNTCPIQLGAGFSFGPALPVTAHWCAYTNNTLLGSVLTVCFSVNKRRPIAYAVVAAGSSIGGVIFPLAVKRLIPEVGCVLVLVYFPSLVNISSDLSGPCESQDLS